MPCSVDIRCVEEGQPSLAGGALDAGTGVKLYLSHALHRSLVRLCCSTSLHPDPSVLLLHLQLSCQDYSEKLPVLLGLLLDEHAYTSRVAALLCICN
jgi:hypothetical protein